ncbi:Fic family protein [Aquirufa antheringensis]|jgi:Fic family protein|uniref:Fic family protein n=1 Tax=Aquirufa antheringensis TaxID=2516559 RepID=UPI001033006B|nr:Fic family protein [Aquirufa antheringensis]MCE4217903.1 winged helix-turn-helix transcriptional regulator [Pseudarcicella sp. GAP-15]TBH71500.1 Fic family protein [Aquirufa antheringensis]
MKINNLQLDLDMALVSEIAKIDRFDAAWANYEKREGDSLKQLKSIATVQSVGASTRIEGSQMTDDEVKVFINKIEISSFTERDQQEVAGYFETLDTIAEHFGTIEISENQIMGLHSLLLKYGEKDAWHRGKFKQVSNSVEANLADGSKQIIFKTSEPGLRTQDDMIRLLEWYRTDKETLPLIKAALFVYEFLSIHPFQDGNGRLSRLLGSLLLLKSGYSWIQYISFEKEIESRKSAYYKVLIDTQRNRPSENVTEWLRFFLSCLSHIQENLLLKLDQRRTDNFASNQRERKILFFIENHPGCSSGEISSKLDLALPTVKKDLKELVEKKVIYKEGVGRGTAYFLI